MEYNLLLDQVRIFWLVLARLMGLMAAAPVLGSPVMRTPPQLLMGLGSGLALVVMMSLPDQLVVPELGWGFALLLIGELFVGLVLGFAANLVIVGIQCGGEIIDHLIGFAVVDVIDPVSNESASLIGNMKGLMATILFIMLNGHHFLFRGLMRTFTLVPPGQVTLAPQVWEMLGPLGNMVFTVALQVAAPFLIVMTLIYVPEGFLARMVPQLNLMINDVPMRIGLGLFLVWLGIVPFVGLCRELVLRISELPDELMVLLVSG